MAKKFVFLLSLLFLVACTKKAENASDPFESFNRKVYKFNNAFDVTVLKPPAKIYKAILPPQIRDGIANAYDNVQLIPTAVNDILQGKLLLAYKASWRLLLNSTLGVAGLFDPASQMGLPQHYNDLGITLAKWGDTDSPYLVLPFLGPSTLRDTYGLFFEYTGFTVYPHIKPEKVRYSLLLLRYIDLRARLLDKEPLLEEALDEYSFIRDAYLQNRHYLITGEEGEEIENSLYIEGEDEDETGLLYIEEDEEENKDIDNKKDDLSIVTPPLRHISPPLRT